jgi:hypothetical protein
MGQFGTDTRKWLLSAIKQRKLLLKTNRSHKSELHVEMALDLLDNLLSAYSYENDLFMARFINQHSDDISILLPGKGSTSFEKKHKEFVGIVKQAILIEDIETSSRVRPKQKITEYEFRF